jgi:hypothetical protein
MRINQKQTPAPLPTQGLAKTSADQKVIVATTVSV